MHTRNFNLDSMRNPRFAKEMTSCTHGERVRGIREKEYVHHTTHRGDVEQLIEAVSAKINMSGANHCHQTDRHTREVREDFGMRGCRSVMRAFT
jgi:hypothetical protein